MGGGGGKGGNKGPSASDQARAQGAANREAIAVQGVVNARNQTTPFGTINYIPVEGGLTTRFQAGNRWEEVPLEYEIEQTLSPNQQRMLDLQEQAGIGLGEIAGTQLTNLSGELNTPLSFSQFGAVPGSAGAGGRNALADALYARQEPLFDRDKAQLETRLANQGITQGSEAYNDAMDTFQRGVNDARLTATIGANQEQTRQLQARQQGINELLQQRGAPINEIAALLSGSQVNLPQQVPVAQAPALGTDVIGAYGLQSQANARRQAGSQALLGSLFGSGAQLGSAGIGLLG